MATENLSINISSDVSGAVTGISQLGNALDRVNTVSVGVRTQIGRTTSTIISLGSGSVAAAVNVGKLAPALTQFSGSLAVFIGQARNGQLSFTGLANGAQNAGRAVIAGTAGIARGSNQAGTALTNLGRVASDAPFGFIAIQNNLDPLLDSFRRLSVETGSTGGALKALGQSLLGGAGIGLAFTLVSSAITTLIQKYGSLSNAFAALNPFISASERFQVSLNKALADGAAKGQEEVAHVQLLYKASQDLNVPLGDRKKIVDELQKQYPDTFKGLSDEAILAGEAAGAYDRLTQSLTAAAAVKATEDLAAAQLKDLVKLRIEATNLEAKLQEIRNPKGGRGIFDISDTNVIGARINSTIADIKDNKEQQLKVEDKLAQVQAEQLKLVEQYGAAALKINAIEPPKTKKADKTELQKIQEILTGIDTAFIKLDATFVATGGALDKLSTDKISVLSNALGDLAQFGVLPGTKIFDQLKGKIDDLQSTLTHTPINFQIPINIQPLPRAQNTAAIDGITKGIKDDFANGLVDVQKIVNDALKSGAAQGIDTISQGIGAAIGGGGLKAAFGGFIDAISNFGQSLGKQLIAQGVALIAFNASLKSLNGPTAIIAGAALIAASAAFKSLAGKGVSAFATGGTVFGPQLALIGDNPGREEHIIPSEVLDKMNGGKQELSLELGVNDFIIWLNRGTRNNG